jgi:hypothetical protein
MITAAKTTWAEAYQLNVVGTSQWPSKLSSAFTTGRQAITSGTKFSPL